MLSTSRLTLPPAGLAVKVFLSVVLFIFIVEILFGGHGPIGDKLIPRPTRGGPNLITHGNNKCIARNDDTLATLSTHIRTTCLKSAPFSPNKGRIGVAVGEFGPPQQGYLNALESHHLHSMVHGTELHVMCEKMIDDLWNKPAFLLSILLDEMLKPESQRLEWIFWVDRDTVILDQCRPISSFIPPPPIKHDVKDGEVKPEEKPEVHMLISNDLNGLNNGIFLMKVSQWSINLLLDILAFRDYKPEVELRFTEQSAMENVLKEPKFSPNVQYVPQHWFNAYPQAESKDFAQRADTEGMDEYHVRRGDFLVHFAGHGDKGKKLTQWWDMSRQLDNVWESHTVQRDVNKEIKEWWQRNGYSPGFGTDVIL